MSKVKKIEITNIEDNTKTVFESIRKAAVSLNSNHTTLREYIKSGKLFKGRAACGSDQLALGETLRVSTFLTYYMSIIYSKLFLALASPQPTSL
jgi:hypothetical protein